MKTNLCKITVALLLAALIAAAGGFLFWQFGKNKTGTAAGPLEEASGHDFLRSAYMDPDSYDSLFGDLPGPGPKDNIVGAVVPHHFLAKNQMARLYDQIGNKNIELVYLASPDHFANFFETGKIIYTSDLPWQTPFGNIFAEKKSIGAIIGTGKGAACDYAVGLEHGITTEAPFVKYFFPNAKIVPLVLKNSSDYAAFFNLGQKIKEISPTGAIMVVSSDFCHEVPVGAAKRADQKSIELLKNLNIKTLNLINSDCRQCLALLAGYMGAGKYDFTLVDKTNSFEISGQDPGSVTSYVAGYFSCSGDF